MENTITVNVDAYGELQGDGTIDVYLAFDILDEQKILNIDLFELIDQMVEANEFGSGGYDMQTLYGYQHTAQKLAQAAEYLQSRIADAAADTYTDDLS